MMTAVQIIKKKVQNMPSLVLTRHEFPYILETDSSETNTLFSFLSKITFSRLISISFILALSFSVVNTVELTFK